MNTAVTSFRRTESLPSHATPVRLSKSLAYFVGGETLVDGHYSPVQGYPSAADIREAGVALPRAEHLCRDADPHVIAAWLEKFRGLPKAPPDPEAVKRAVAAMILANGDLPASVWTAETAALGLREWHWYPTPADVRALLLPHAQAFWKQRDGLQRVIGSTAPSVAVKEPPTPEMEKHVAAVVSSFVAERSFNHDTAAPTGKREVKPAPVSQGALIEHYRRLAEGGDSLAATRLRMLEGTDR